MKGTARSGLEGVAGTMLLTLYLRAMETRRPDAILRDERAAALVDAREDDFEKVRRIPMKESDKASLMLRNRRFDRYARGFLERRGESVVVHAGCGLDQRFERVDDGRVEWYDLDFPEVIALRRAAIGEPGPRNHLISASLFDASWMDAVEVHRGRPLLLIAEGVSMYCREEQVRDLVLTLRDRFPGSELVLDVFSPLHVRISNLQNASHRLGVRFHWGVWRGRALESWGDGIRLMDDWGFFDEPEPRMAGLRWMRFVPFLNSVMRIYHYGLG